MVSKKFHFCWLLMFALLFCSGCNKSSERFQRRMEQMINPYQLQKWALPIIDKHDIAYEIPKKEWPNFLLVTNGPSSAWVAGWADKKERTVIVAWGGGFGHTGLIVGNTNFVITTEERGSLTIPWIPGVYFCPIPE